MAIIDWRELYASNRAAIEAGGGAPGAFPPALGALAEPRPARPRVPGGGARARPRVPGGRARAGAPGAGPPRRAPRGAAQQRRVVVHVPAGLDPRTAAPLVCMLHGCTQDAASFAGATRMNAEADRHGFVVVYPQQGRADNPQGCWNWFVPEHQGREAGEPAWIAGAVREAAAAAPATIDARRVFVAGLSAGGAMAAVLARAYPDVFAAAAVHSGLAPGSAANLGAALNAMARGAAGDAADAPGPRPEGRVTPTMVVHGTADRTVAPANAEHVLRAAMRANELAAPGTGRLDPSRPSSTVRGQVDGGHAYLRSRWTDRHGALRHELLLVEGLGHAWSGGAAGGSFTDPQGPDATAAIWRFFAEASARPARALH